MADTTTELEVLDQIVDVLGGQSGQYETVVPTLQQILALLGGGNGGYNPSISVGRADALTGADTTAQWATRESTGTGSATVRSVQGATVAWNQLVGSDTSSVTVPSGHKYLGIINGTSTIATSDGTPVSVTGGTDQLFDLTVMFGAGSEPATVAEFEAMCPTAHYPYSAPTLKPVQIAGIVSMVTQSNALDNVVWPTQTLRAAGSVRDELTAGAVVRSVGEVTLGADNCTVTYIEVGTNQTRVQVNVTDWDGKGGANVTSDQFVTGPADWNHITLGTCRATTGGLFLGLPTTVTNNSQAKSWIVEHAPKFYYELATPTTTPISPALPVTYRVEQGGTEAIIVPIGEVSAAPIITIAEGESAGELVMDALACIATPDGPTATANHSVGTYLTMQGKLWKVTSAIAVGESIVAGTNITQTTVMAELLALTA